MYKKRLIISIIFAIIFILICANKSNAETSGDYEYDILVHGTADITGYTGNETEVNIPSTLDGREVYSIGDGAFKGNTKIKSVTIPDTVKLLKDDTFMNCTNLSTVNLPNTLKYIYNGAFQGCTSLKTIKIPKSILKIEKNAFDSNFNLDISNTNLEKREDGDYVVFEDIKVNVTEDYEKAFEMLELVNAEREKRGVTPLVMNESLLESAMLRAAETSIIYAHVRPDYSFANTAINVSYTIFGENILRTAYSTSQEALEIWMNSSQHGANIVAGEFNSIGIGCCKVNGIYFWTQIFIDTKTTNQVSKPNNQSKTYTIRIAPENFKLSISNDNVVLEEGEEKTNNLRIASSYAASDSVALNLGQFTIKNSNPEVATVNNNGKITGIKEGTTTIEIITDKGSSISYTVTVTRTRVSFTQSVIELEEGESIFLYDYIKLSAETTYTKNYLKWKNTNPAVAEIEYIYYPYTKSEIKAKSPGTTSITAYLPNGEEATCTIKVKGLPFTDVKKDDWFFSSVEYCYEKGIILGTSDTTYNPNTKLTRGMLVTILHRMDGKPAPKTQNQFKDVYKSQYYYDAVIWANEKGIVHGYGDGSKFGPDDNITRQDLAVILRNFAQYKEKNVNVTSNLNKFKDGNIVSDYAKSAVKWAVGKGVITGNNNGESLTPHANSTRAEAAGMIYNYCTKVNL